MSSQLVFMRASDRATSALKEMRLSAIRHMPVVDAEGRFVGMVSSTDLQASVGRKDDPELGAIMAPEVQTVRIDTPAERAVALMIDQKCDAVPVVGENQELVGILTTTDFLVVAYQALTGATIERSPDEL